MQKRGLGFQFFKPDNGRGTTTQMLLTQIAQHSRQAIDTAERPALSAPLEH